MLKLHIDITKKKKKMINIIVGLFRGRLLVGTFVALSFNLFTMLSIRNKPFAYVSEGMFFIYR